MMENRVLRGYQGEARGRGESVYECSFKDLDLRDMHDNPGGLQRLVLR